LILELAVSLRELLIYLIGAEHGATIEAVTLQENNLAKLEFVSGHSVLSIHGSSTPPPIYHVASLKFIRNDAKSGPNR
jgi:hypothetical protein